MTQNILLGCFLIWACILASCVAYTPVVLMHGVNADASSVSGVQRLLEGTLPGIYVKAAEIGDGVDDSLFWPIGYQVEQFCTLMKSDPKLANGFNLMGFSQGGILTRGYVEMCNDPPVKNYISWVAPQMGVWGVPKWGHIKYINWTLDDIADCCAYDDWAQDIFSFFGYWRDPFELSTYVNYCRYLPVINNERDTKNSTYKKNMLSLKNFVMSWSTADQTLIPPQTGWFGTIAANTYTQIVPLEQQPMYIEDWIGLRTLDESGRLHRFTTNCSHADYHSDCFQHFFFQYVFPFLSEE